MGSDVVSFKLVVTGPFGAGKTTLIQAISQTPVVATEVPNSVAAGVGGSTKASTTVSMDFGTRVVEGGPGEPSVELLMFGTPGQERFSFMWEILARGMDGLLVVVDASSPGTWGEAAAMLRAFRRMHRGPLVVAANRAAASAVPLDHLGPELGLEGHVPVVGCEVIEPASARDVVLTLLEEVLVHGEG